MHHSLDERRDLFIGKTQEEALHFAEEHWVNTAKRAIATKGSFSVALSGGSTPNTLYHRLSQRSDLPWEQIFLFWGDERSVPPTSPESNYYTAMQSGLKACALPQNTFRMAAEEQIQTHALSYEHLIKKLLDPSLFDLVMLGVGEDGHTASLFPDTKALTVKDRLVVANYVPEKSTWRMTLTFAALHQSQATVFYALGKAKSSILPQVLAQGASFPASFVGTVSHKSLWIIDADAASNLKYL